MEGSVTLQIREILLIPPSFSITRKTGGIQFQMIHIAICEDIETHANKMKELLTAVLPKNITLTHYTSSKKMLSDIQNSHIIYDLAIMDIELGDASGITLSSRLSEYCPDIQIIFVSQYLKYVSPVYETAHTYFIYKPELELYLKPAVQKALQKIEEHSHLILTLSWNKKKTEILQKDICYMERLLRKTAVYTLHDTFYTAEKLSSILAQLSPSFTLCHRSYLINLEQLSAFLPGYLCLKDGRQIPVSRSYIQSVREQFLQIYRD